MSGGAKSGAADGYVGQALLSDGGTEFGSTAFLVKSMMGRAQTSTLVQVQAVASPGGIGPVGLVDVLPMVAQIDGDGNTTPHAVIHNVPYLRLQGGANAVIIDPAVGDIGIAIFASRDLSKVKATRKPGPPGSRRRNDSADALYLGGLLNGTPTAYAAFTADGIVLTSPIRVTVNAPAIALSGAALTHNGVNVGATHTHPDAQGGKTGVPQ